MILPDENIVFIAERFVECNPAEYNKAWNKVQIIYWYGACFASSFCKISEDHLWINKFFTFYDGIYPRKFLHNLLIFYA